MRSWKLLFAGISLVVLAVGLPLANGIVGGRVAEQQFPFMAALEDASGQLFCGGTLINPEWVVTAGHCVQDTPIESGEAIIRIGSNDQQEGGVVRRVAESVLASGFFQQTAEDIALIRLDDPVQQAPLLVADQAPPPGTPVQLLGWGQECPERGCGGTPRQLKELDTRLLDDGVCSGVESLFDPRTELCVDSPDGQGACFGDSGGPAIALVDGAPRLVGVTSRGTQAQCAVGPAIYTDVSAFKERIDRVIAQRT